MQKITFTSKSYNDANLDNKPNLRIVEPSYDYQIEQDSFEFVDCPIEEKRTAFQKIGEFFSSKASNINSLTNKQAFDKACVNQCEAIKKRKVALELIKFGASRDFRPMTGLKGNRITFDFEKDPLGRALMLEWNFNNEVERMTVFIPGTGEISRIEERQPNTKKYNRYSYFKYDCEDIEVQKGIVKSKYYSCINPSLLGETVDDIYTLNADKSIAEIYSYKKGEPTSLKRGCKIIPDGTSAIESYKF